MKFRDTTGKGRSESIANNRPKSRGLHPVGALARTHRKKSLPIGGRPEKETKYKRSEPIVNNRPESRGLHQVGALARTHRKKSLPIGGRLKSLPSGGDRALEDPEPWRWRSRSPGSRPTPEDPQKKPGSG